MECPDCGGGLHLELDEMDVFLFCEECDWEGDLYQSKFLQYLNNRTKDIIDGAGQDFIDDSGLMVKAY